MFRQFHYFLKRNVCILYFYQKRNINVVFLSLSQLFKQWVEYFIKLSILVRQRKILLFFIIVMTKGLAYFPSIFSSSVCKRKIICSRLVGSCRKTVIGRHFENFPVEEYMNSINENMLSYHRVDK
jgi:hypothetical protein